jgi:Class II Aldolase and Adducin N-terminal domain
VSLGPIVPKVPFAPPGPAATAALAPWCEVVDAVLLAGHGVMAWGADPEQALLRLELVEHLATIALAAVPLGGPTALPDDVVAPLMAARARARIGKAADRAVEIAARFAAPGARPDPVAPPPGPALRRVVACAPAPHAPDVQVVPLGRRSPDLADIVRDEVVRALEE